MLIVSVFSVRHWLGDSWGAKQFRQELAQKVCDFVNEPLIGHSTFYHVPITKHVNGAFSHSIQSIVQSLSHSVIQSSTHCYSATFPRCRLFLVNAWYIRTEALYCTALFMDGNGQNLLTGLHARLDSTRIPAITRSPQAPLMGPQKEQINHSTRVSRSGKGFPAPRRNLKMPVERLAPQKDDGWEVSKVSIKTTWHMVLGLSLEHSTIIIKLALEHCSKTGIIVSYYCCTYITQVLTYHDELWESLVWLSCLTESANIST